jgi:hypothetical protein
MIQIDDVVVSLDCLREKFCCDISACHGECCIEGDAGAPVEQEEVEKLEEVLPEIWNDLLPQAQQQINEHGLAYVDVEGELVTQLVGGANCVFTTYERGDMCLCAIEKAYREGRIKWRKPISCYLYPVRIKKYPGYEAVNFDRWKICKCAEVLGRREKIRLYQFLKEPLVERFGQQWYDQLVASCELYIREYLE